jgi:bifunctional UDP-N-acetylglucosamine pyrophosphorylase/glucosamine-1-phosphate N-acetyltransferase
VIGGRTLLGHVLDRIAEVAPGSSVGIIVGHKAEQVRESVQSDEIASSLKISFILQQTQQGTGHAVKVAMDSEWGEEVYKRDTPVLVLPGDQPVISSELIRQMIEPLPRTHCMRVLTCELEDPKGYGRIVRRGKEGPILKIVEEKDATLREKQIREVGTSTYLFQPGFLKASLRRLSNKNAQNEYYLTDLVSIAVAAKKKIEILKWAHPDELRGINNPWELSLAAKSLNRRILKDLAENHGVRIQDPETTWIDSSVEVGEDVAIGPGVILQGRCKIGKRAQIDSYVVLKNVVVGEDAHVKVGTVAEDSVIESGVKIGPYAHLRPESHIGKNSKIGNFVELKKTKIGEDTSIAHLSYLGDAEVGNRVNIGCGFVTCNFDGRVIDGSRKHKTIIEDEVFMGSDCQTVAPVRIGKGAYVASGSTVTEDVPPGDLAIARCRQVNKPGYASRLKK